MPLITSPGLVIAPAFQYENFNPLVGWQSYVTFSNITATSELANFPATNLFSPNTYEFWKSNSTGTQYITVSSIDGQLDYIGIVGHNWGTDGSTISIEAITSAPGAVMTEIFPPFIPSDDKVLLIRFALEYYITIRIKIVPSTTAPQAAHIKAGKLLAIRPGIAPGYTPLSESPNVDFYAGVSSSGEFLGTIINGSSLSSSAKFQDMDGDWYNTYMIDFIRGFNYGDTFFFAWSPSDYPSQVNYCWMASPAKPNINRRTGQRDLDLNMNGVDA